MKTVNVELRDRAYTIHVGAQTRHKIAALLDSAGRHQTVLITDETVAGLHLAALRAVLVREPRVLTVPAGEASKSLCQVERVYDELAAAHIERQDVLIAFGGGMVGDLTGFVAATWLRGIRFVQIPTTLVAAVDAAVGGKTGINHAAGKNLIGAFHQPAAVLIDTDFLGTLAQRDYACGLAESIKQAVVRSADFVSWHEANAVAIAARADEVLTELIARNCAIKADVVTRDERELSLRVILNHGHTIGHALEHILGYELRHGECVALGMLVENELAAARGQLGRTTAGRIAALLAQFGLPTRLPRPVDADEVVLACQMDKKNRLGAVNFVLLQDLGRPVRVTDVSQVEIAAALRVVQPA
ncbi:MAG: 3-dehydroquinate synthase [Planctomycetes bacterium]|nr:3-dehydroquinate synthase [Planctomycetota bacterium]